MKPILILAFASILVSCAGVMRSVDNLTKPDTAQAVIATGKAVEDSGKGTPIQPVTDIAGLGLGALGTILASIAALKANRTDKLANARIDKTKGEVDELWEKTHKPVSNV